MFENLGSDMGRFIDCSGDKQRLLPLFFNQGVWALAVYRFGNWARRTRIPLVSSLIKFVTFFLFKMVEITTGISIPFSVQIGPGFYIAHFGGIIINGNARIGNNCSVGTGVIIGIRGGEDKGAPVIGNNVFMGVGAKVLGRIRIGDNVKIGANAVVLADVPDGCTAAGVPAKIVKRPAAL